MRRCEFLNTRYVTTRGGKSANKRKKGDMNCPMTLFCLGLEAWFVLDVICKDIEKQRSEIPIYTIHDALLTTPEYVEDIVDIIKKRSKEIFGVELEIKTSYC